jgi:hypothetical protein
MDKNEINTYLRRISNILLINGSYMKNLGLHTGEMGLVLFFYRYARLTQNEVFLAYSSYLLEKIQNKINQNTPVNYKQGLSGIGATIEYLAQNGFLETSTDDFLEDFDKRIFFTFNLPYLSIDKIADIGYYALWRLSGNSARKDIILKSVMPQIVNVMEEWQTSQNMLHPMVSFFKDMISAQNTNLLYDRSITSSRLQLCREKSSNNSDETTPFAHLLELFSNNNDLDLGFQNGLTSLGLFLITELDGDDSWLSLFPNDIIHCQT